MRGQERSGPHPLGRVVHFAVLSVNQTATPKQTMVRAIPGRAQVVNGSSDKVYVVVGLLGGGGIHSACTGMADNSPFAYVGALRKMARETKDPHVV